MSGLDSFLSQAEQGIDVGVKLDLPQGTTLIILGVIMATMLILRPSGITGGREFSLPRAWRPAAAPAIHSGRHASMRICIVGCGAVGSLFAANLATLDDVEVWAFDLSQPHVDAIGEHGLRLCGAGEVHGRLHATSDAGGAAALRLRHRRHQGHARRVRHRRHRARLRRRGRGLGHERRRQRGSARAATSSA